MPDGRLRKRRAHPQLRHVVGKLYRRIDENFMQQVRISNAEHDAMEVSTAPKRTPRKKYARIRRGEIVVHSIVRPEPDLNKLVKVLVLTTQEDMKDTETDSQTGR